MDRIQKLVKKDSAFFLVGVIFIGITFGLLFLWFYSTNNYDNSFSNDLAYVNEEDVKAYVETTYTPYAVAETTNGMLKYAIVVDEDNIMYLIKGYVNSIQMMYDSQSSSSSVTLRGVTHKIEDKIKGFTIDSYNEYADEIIVDEENFSSFFGNYYLDLDEYVEDKVAIDIAFISLMIFTLSTGIIIAIIGLVSKIKTKKTMSSEDFSILISEIDNPLWETKNVIFTKNHIVFDRTGLRVLNYKDILWVYLHTFIYNGVPNNSFAYFVRGVKNINLIPVGLKSDKALEMIEIVSSKNPDVLVGYTNENKEKYKSIK